MTCHYEPAAEAMSAQDVMRELNGHGDAEVTVKIAGTMLDVIRVIYDPDRDKFVLQLHPDDVDDALRRLYRRM